MAHQLHVTLFFTYLIVVRVMYVALWINLNAEIHKLTLHNDCRTCEVKHEHNGVCSDDDSHFDNLQLLHKY